MESLLKNIFAFTLILLLPIIWCSPIENAKSHPEIIKYEFNQLPNNGYHFLYELSDGQARDEKGLFDVATGIFKVTGYYSYIDGDKNKYLVMYTADENGFNIENEEQEIESDVSIDQPSELSSASIATLAAGK